MFVSNTLYFFVVVFYKDLKKKKKNWENTEIRIGRMRKRRNEKRQQLWHPDWGGKNGNLLPNKRQHLPLGFLGPEERYLLVSEPSCDLTWDDLGVAIVDENQICNQKNNKI